MKARNLMTHHPITVRPGDSVAHAASQMGSCEIGLLPVVEDLDRRLMVGVITDRDIVIRCTARGHDPQRCLVEHHMTVAPLASVAPEAELREIVRKLEANQLRRIPVVDGEGAVVGVIAQADLARCVGPDNPALIEELLERVSASPAQLPG